MTEHSQDEIELLYSKFHNFRDVLRNRFRFDGGTMMRFYSDDIDTFPSIKEQLLILDSALTAYFGAGAYRNLIDSIRLAYFLKFDGIAVKVVPICRQLNFNGLTLYQIHHDEELTPIIVSQFTYPKDFGFGGSNYGSDVETGNIAVEVGDTLVHKIVKGLKEDYEEVWVIPIYRKSKSKILESVYKFSKGEFWNGVEWWSEKEQHDSDEWRRKIIQEVKW